VGLWGRRGDVGDLVPTVGEHVGNWRQAYHPRVLVGEAALTGALRLGRWTKGRGCGVGL